MECLPPRLAVEGQPTKIFHASYWVHTPSSKTWVNDVISHLKGVMSLYLCRSMSDKRLKTVGETSAKAPSFPVLLQRVTKIEVSYNVINNLPKLSELHKLTYLELAWALKFLLVTWVTLETIPTNWTQLSLLLSIVASYNSMAQSLAN